MPWVVPCGLCHSYQARYLLPMSTDPRAALDRFIAALEAHFEIASSVQDAEAVAVEDAAAAVEDAFFTYDDALYTTYQVEVPLEAYGDDDEDDLEDEELEDFDLDDEDDDEEG